MEQHLCTQLSHTYSNFLAHSPAATATMHGGCMALLDGSDDFDAACCTPHKAASLGDECTDMWECMDTSDLNLLKSGAHEQDSSPRCLVNGHHHTTNSSCTYMDVDTPCHWGGASSAGADAATQGMEEVQELSSPTHVSRIATAAEASATPLVSEAAPPPPAPAPPPPPPPPPQPSTPLRSAANFGLQPEADQEQACPAFPPHSPTSSDEDLVALAAAAAAAAAAVVAEGAADQPPSWGSILDTTCAVGSATASALQQFGWEDLHDWVSLHTVEFPTDGPIPASVPVAFVAGQSQELSMPLTALHSLAFSKESGSPVLRSYSCLKGRAREMRGLFNVSNSGLIAQLRDMGAASPHTSNVCFITLSAAAQLMQQLGHSPAVVEAVQDMHLQANLGFLAAHMQARGLPGGVSGTGAGVDDANPGADDCTGDADMQECCRNGVGCGYPCKPTATATKDGGDQRIAKYPNSRKRCRGATIPSPYSCAGGTGLPAHTRVGSLKELYARDGVVLGAGEPVVSSSARELPATAAQLKNVRRLVRRATKAPAPESKQEPAQPATLALAPAPAPPAPAPPPAVPPAAPTSTPTAPAAQRPQAGTGAPAVPTPTGKVKVKKTRQQPRVSASPNTACAGVSCGGYQREAPAAAVGAEAVLGVISLKGVGAVEVETGASRAGAAAKQGHANATEAGITTTKKQGGDAKVPTPAAATPAAAAAAMKAPTGPAPATTCVRLGAQPVLDLTNGMEQHEQQQPAGAAHKHWARVRVQNPHPAKGDIRVQGMAAKSDLQKTDTLQPQKRPPSTPRPQLLVAKRLVPRTQGTKPQETPVAEPAHDEPAVRPVNPQASQEHHGIQQHPPPVPSAPAQQVSEVEAPLQQLKHQQLPEIPGVLDQDITLVTLLSQMAAQDEILQQQSPEPPPQQLCQQQQQQPPPQGAPSAPPSPPSPRLQHQQRQPTPASPPQQQVQQHKQQPQQQQPTPPSLPVQQCKQVKDQEQQQGPGRQEHGTCSPALVDEQTLLGNHALQQQLESHAQGEASQQTCLQIVLYPSPHHQGQEPCQQAEQLGLKPQPELQLQSVVSESQALALSQYCPQWQQAEPLALVPHAGVQPTQSQLSPALQEALDGRDNNAEVLFLAVDELLCEEASCEAHLTLAGSSSLPQILATRVMSLRSLLKRGRLEQAATLVWRIVQVAATDAMHHG